MHMTSVLAAPSLGDAASKVIVPILSQFLIVVHLSVYCSTKRCFPFIQAVGEFRGTVGLLHQWIAAGIL